MPQFLQSLNRIEALECDIVYPGHGEPFTDHRAVIQKQRARINVRKQQCLSLLNEGYRTLGQLVLKMYPKYPPEFRFAGLWMAMGYLDLLAENGQIKLVEQVKNGQTVVEIDVVAEG